MKINVTESLTDRRPSIKIPDYTDLYPDACFYSNITKPKPAGKKSAGHLRYSTSIILVCKRYDKDGYSCLLSPPSCYACVLCTWTRAANLHRSKSVFLKPKISIFPPKSVLFHNFCSTSMRLSFIHWTHYLYTEKCCPEIGPIYP